MFLLVYTTSGVALCSKSVNRFYSNTAAFKLGVWYAVLCVMLGAFVGPYWSTGVTMNDAAISYEKTIPT